VALEKHEVIPCLGGSLLNGNYCIIDLVSQFHHILILYRFKLNKRHMQFNIYFYKKNMFMVIYLWWSHVTKLWNQGRYIRRIRNFAFLAILSFTRWNVDI